MSIQDDLESCEDEQLFDNQPVKILHKLTLFTIAVSVDLITSISTTDSIIHCFSRIFFNR